MAQKKPNGLGCAVIAIALWAGAALWHGCYEVDAQTRPPVPATELGAEARTTLAQMVQIEGESDHDGAAVLWTLAHRRDQLWQSQGWTIAETAYAYSRVLRREVPLSPRMIRILDGSRQPPGVTRLVDLWGKGLIVDPCVRPTLHWGAPGSSPPRGPDGRAMVPVACGPTDNVFFGLAGAGIPAAVAAGRGGR